MATLQLGSRERAYVLDIPALVQLAPADVDALLATVLHSPSVLKLGEVTRKLSGFSYALLQGSECNEGEGGATFGWQVTP